jgi:type I restriction enzyme S subunit
MIELTRDQLSVVRRIVAEHLPQRDVRVFGSRAHGRGLKSWSDLDLAVLGDEPLSAAQSAALAQAFDESDLPFRVEVLAWRDAPPALRVAIARDGVALEETAPTPHT